MRLSKGITAVALAATVMTSALAWAPMTLAQDSKSPDAKAQKQKNDWRNLAIGAGAIAGYGVLKGNSAATLLGAAGAAYAAKRYEDERKSQDEAKRARMQYHRGSSDYDYESMSPSTRTTTTTSRSTTYYHHTSPMPNVAGRKYYHYQGHLYYVQDGQRHLVD